MFLSLMKRNTEKKPTNRCIVTRDLISENKINIIENISIEGSNSICWYVSISMGHMPIITIGCLCQVHFTQQKGNCTSDT